jgi:hypothetical protein
VENGCPERLAEFILEDRALLPVETPQSLQMRQGRFRLAEAMVNPGVQVQNLSPCVHREIGMDVSA